MRAITTKDCYESIELYSEKIIYRNKNIPDNVFKDNFNKFLFLTFDDLLMPIFFNNLKKFLLEVGENVFWITSISPDPKIYFGENFNFFGSIEFSVYDKEKDYMESLNNYPEDSPADALAHNANSLMLFSPCCDWSVYGDRDSDIVVCAFSDIKKMEIFKNIYSSDLLGGVDSAANYAYSLPDSGILMERFCEGYSVK